LPSSPDHFLIGRSPKGSCNSTFFPEIVKLFRRILFFMLKTSP